MLENVSSINQIPNQSINQSIDRKTCSALLASEAEYNALSQSIKRKKRETEILTQIIDHFLIRIKLNFKFSNIFYDNFTIKFRFLTELKKLNNK